MIAESHPQPSLSQGSPALRVLPKAGGSAPDRLPTSPPAVLLDAETARERYERLCARRQILLDQGRLEDALRVNRSALECAQEVGDPELIALAECNVAALSISLGDLSGPIPDLRRILMRNFSADTSFAAAYNLSHAYELDKNFKKSLFYGRIALDRAMAANDAELRAKSLHQIGNGLVGESHFSRAAQQYQEALTLMKQRLDGLTVPPRISCAYCLIVMGQVHEGMGQLFSCLRWMKRHDRLPIFQAWSHIFLCCGYLELDRFRDAWRHGIQAKELAEATGDFGAVKSSLFLLGEVERSAGDMEGAHAWFQEMQERFYPDHPEMPELMAVVGMTQVVNLKA